MVAIAVCALGVARAASATPITITIGDNDGYGFGAGVVLDGASRPAIDPGWPPIDPGDPNPEDRRSPGEKAATNGAQQTDIYSALLDPLPATVNFIFPFTGALTDATLTIDMGGFQASSFGQMSARYNGVVQSNLLNFEGDALATNLRLFVLGPAALAAANAAGQFVLTVDRGSSTDGVSFDYLQLNGTTVPEPGSLFLLGLGLLAVAHLGRRYTSKS
jgi:hypothetical protein